MSRVAQPPVSPNSLLAASFRPSRARLLGVQNSIAFWIVRGKCLKRVSKKGIDVVAEGLETAQSAPPLATKYLLLASAKAGVGKTTCARNIAAAATLAGRRVAMIDLDQQRSLSKWWERRPDEAPQIDCFSANIDQIQDVLAAVDGYSLVVIDTPPAVEFFPVQIKALDPRSILFSCQPVPLGMTLIAPLNLWRSYKA